MRTTLLSAHQALQSWAQDKPELLALCQRYDALSRRDRATAAGPTGERNTFTLLPRDRCCVSQITSRMR